MHTQIQGIKAVLSSTELLSIIIILNYISHAYFAKGRHKLIHVQTKISSLHKKFKELRLLHEPMNLMN